MALRQKKAMTFKNSETPTSETIGGTAEKPFRMTISLNVLRHLGINLYSNAPAVLTEVVANAWDADASEVRIELSKERIVIQDNGSGMNSEDFNARYLKVGYAKRDAEPELTPKYLRLPMGRKGIGKLSLFSIADTVEVQSAKGGIKNSLVMKATEIEKAIKDKDAGGDYFPSPLNPQKIVIEQGTRIVLADLKHRATLGTANAVRKRLARRFSIIGFPLILSATPQPCENGGGYSSIASCCVEER